MLAVLHLDTSPAGKILLLLQEHGACTIKEIATALRVTRSAIRPPLQTLCAADLVTTTVVHQGRGRPHMVYGLSDKGQRLFPQLYEVLASILWDELCTRPSGTGLPHLLGRLSARLGAQYARRLGRGPLGTRLQALRGWLAEHGVRSEIEAGATTYRLAMHACPYAALARRHREVCAVESAAMTDALGVPVTLHQSRLDGHPCCQFAILHATPSAHPA